MKKSLLIAMAVIVGLAAFAQRTTYQLPTVNPAMAKKTMKASQRKVFDQAAVKAKPGTLAKAKKNNNLPAVLPPTETKIGESTYDLQTNGSVANRCVLNANGTVQATWTFSTELNATWSDRGTGYNYYDGTSWGPFPTTRIENVRTGWPELITLANGTEVIISHAPAEAALVMSTRNPYGSGTWTTSPLTNLAPLSILWPRAASGGPDGNTIHLIAHNEAQTVVDGVTGMVSYSRSLDGGLTWDIQSVKIPGLDNTNYAFLSADGYALAANGNNVAVVYFGALEKTVLAKSTDNGTTWTYRELFDIPFIYDPNSTNTIGSPLGISDVNGDQVADTIFNVTDGAGTVVVDNNGVAHVFFGFMNYLDDAAGDGSWSFFPVTDGIGYWNENMGFMEPQFIAGILDLDGSGVLLDNLTDPNTEFGQYYSSLSTMPNAGVDANGCLYLVYTAIMETMTSGTQYYRHVLGSKSCDNGCTWSYPIDLTANDEYAECVYPSMAHKVGSQLHFVYQKDGEPGINLQGDADPVGVNEIMHVAENATRLDTVIGACTGGINAYNVQYCNGDSVLVTASCGTAWAWNTGETTQSIYVKTFGDVSCDITTVCGVISDTLNFTAVSTGPAITITASATEVCPGDSVTISTNNVSGATWAWSTGDNTQSIAIDTIGTIVVTVSNCGGSTTDSITINYASAPLANLTAFGNTTFCEGGSVVLNASGAGTGGSYFWYPGAETSTVITVTDSGTYYFTSFNVCGDSAVSNSVNVVVYPAPAVPAVTCFSAGSDWGFIAPQCNTGSCQWQVNGNNVGTNNDSLQLNWQSVGSANVVVIYTDGNNCSATSPNANCFVGVEETMPFAAITVYPNPSDGKFSLIFNKMKNDKYTISVKNILGQVVYSRKATISGNYTMNLDLAAFDGGVYFLTIAGTEGEFTQKVVVR